MSFSLEKIFLESNGFGRFLHNHGKGRKPNPLLLTNTVLVVGLPQHITIACCREHSDHVVFEFFDPAGPDGDLQSVKAVKQFLGWVVFFYIIDRYEKMH